jgi:sulfopyruvate decarboxylase TPP-binding subunit
MQQRKKRTGNIFIITILGICWVAGILIAGSESAYMPWMNLLGLSINGAASYLLCKIPNLKYIMEC